VPAGKGLQAISKDVHRFVDRLFTNCQGRKHYNIFFLRGDEQSLPDAFFSDGINLLYVAHINANRLPDEIENFFMEPTCI